MERKRCGAKTRSGTPCKNWAMTSNDSGRCRMHGGSSLRGMAHPNYVNGRYSKYLPARLMERYEQAAGDPELLNMRSDIALVDSRISDLLGRVDTGESGKLWKRLGSLRAEFLAWQAKDQTRAAEALNELLREVGRGQADFAAWDEVVGLLDKRRRLVEAEQKRLVAMQQMVTAEQAMGLVSALASSVRERVLECCDAESGRKLLAAVQADLTRFSVIGTGQGADG